MDNDFYKRGSLWVTRKKIDTWCNFEEPKNKKRITIPKNEIVMLLKYIQGPTKTDNIKILWNNKILYCLNVDVGHSFILGDYSVVINTN